jgi:Protein of unknown function (DUF2939)
MTTSRAAWGASRTAWLWAAGVVASLGVMAYLATAPYRVAAELRTAFQTHNVAALEPLVDIDAVRASFRSQVGSVIADPSKGGLLGVLVGTIAAKVGDAAVDTIVTPAFLIQAVAARQWMPTAQAAADPSQSFAGAQMGYESPSQFVIRLPPESSAVKLVLTRSGLDWKLSSIVLPRSEGARNVRGS